jgi:hypothetical protein
MLETVNLFTNGIASNPHASFEPESLEDRLSGGAIGGILRVELSSALFATTCSHRSASCKSAPSASRD